MSDAKIYSPCPVNPEYTPVHRFHFQQYIFNEFRLDSGQNGRKPNILLYLESHNCPRPFNSFVRYVEEHIQRTGVAIETQGFSFVTSGRKRESLTVSASLLKKA